MLNFCVLCIIIAKILTGDIKPDWDGGEARLGNLANRKEKKSGSGDRFYKTGS